MTAWFDRIPPEPERLIWCDWLRWHTIDPLTVAIPGWIRIDFARYLIIYLSYELDESGRPKVSPDDQTVLLVERVVQLEARPSPFPLEVGE